MEESLLMQYLAGIFAMLGHSLQNETSEQFEILTLC